MRGLRAFVLGDHGFHGRSVGGAERACREVARPLPLLAEPPEQRRHDGVVAVEVDVFGEHVLALGLGVGVAEAFGVVVAGALVERREAVGGAPAEVGAQHLAGEVVEREPMWPGVHKREAAQPAEERLRADAVQQVGQQRLGERAGHRRSFYRCSVRRARRLFHKPFQQRAHHVRRPGAVGGALGVLGGTFGHQRERHRVAVRGVEHGRVLLGRHAVGLQEIGALVGREVAERKHHEFLLPAQIRRPRRLRRVTAGEHHKHFLVDLGQELLAQPGFERADRLGVVDQQHAAPEARWSPVAAAVARHRERRHRALKRSRSVDGARVDEQRRYPYFLAVAGKGAQQRRLPDAAGAVDGEHVERQHRRREGLAEGRSFGSAADKAGAASSI